MGMMLQPDGLAVGIDHIPELKAMAEKNIRRGNPELLGTNVELIGKFLYNLQIFIPNNIYNILKLI